MTPYEHLEQLASSHGVLIDTAFMEADDGSDGYYIGFDGFGHVIFINRHRTMAQRTAALAEELGHFFRSTGDISQLRDFYARRQELLGRAWSYDHLLPPEQALHHLQNGNGTAWELAEEADLPEPFVQEAVAYHARKGRVTARKPHPPEVQEQLRRRIEREVVQRLTPQAESPAPAPPRRKYTPPPKKRVRRKPAEQGPTLTLQDVRPKYIPLAARRLFGMDPADKRWDAILYAMVLTTAVTAQPTPVTTRTYYFPPVQVRAGTLSLMPKGVTTFDAITQRQYLAPYNKHI